MKCPKCGKKIALKLNFCGNCGYNIKLYKNKILLIFILLLCFIFVLLLLSVKNTNNTYENQFQNLDELIQNDKINHNLKIENTGEKILEDDYKKNLISADKYIQQLSYSLFDRKKLDDKYSNLDYKIASVQELIDEAATLSDEIKPETAAYIVSKVLNINMKNNTIEQMNNDFHIDKINVGDLSQFTKVILSSDKHFLIYFNESYDKNKAKEIGQYLEKVVKIYKQDFNLEFEYTGNITSKVNNSVQLLEKNNIDIKYLKTSLPVYIGNTDLENTGALGYYIPNFDKIEILITKGLSIFEEYNIAIENIVSSYSFPFLVVNEQIPNMDDFKLVTAHELFHHYSKYICGNGKYSECKSGLFTEETTANYAATHIKDINKTNTVINSWSASYISEIYNSLNKVGISNYGKKGIGYGAYVFAHNYEKIVPNGYKVIFDSMKYEDALNYIYNQSPDDYKKAFLRMAEKNVTHEYENKLIKPVTNKGTYYPSNHAELEKQNGKKNYRINYSSINYFYVNPKKFINPKTQIIFSDCQKKDNLYLLAFIRENNSYKYLSTYNLTNDFVINIQDFNYYDEVVFGVVNVSPSNALNYEINISKNSKITPSINPKDFNLKTYEELIDNKNQILCYKIDQENKYLTNIIQVKMGFEHDKLNDLYFRGEYKINYNDDNEYLYEINKKMALSILKSFKQDIENKFKNVDVLMEEKNDIARVTFKVNSNHFDILKNSFNVNENNKKEIIESIHNEGFICIGK